jgi:2-dehydropantoate 2-reductase
MTEPCPNKLRFLMFGVGAIGTYIGGSLALAGQEVVFVERDELAKNITSAGLKLRVKDQEKLVARPVIVGSINEALTGGPFDVAILAIKSYDTQAFIQSMAPYAVAMPPILCFQNGVENEAALAQVLGPDKVIAGTVTSAVGRRGIGDVVLERLRGMGVAGDHVLTASLVSVLNSAGLNARHYRRADAMKWSKMLTNLLANATSAILDYTPTQIFSNTALYRLERRQIKETLAVMKALRIPVVDLPGTPVRALVWAIDRWPIWASQPLMVRFLGQGRGAKMPSFHIDLYAGKPLSEVEYLNGAVVRFGVKTGVATPVNQALTSTLTAMARGEIKKEDFAHQPDKLLHIVDDLR